jgi:hypothetical protein
MLYVIRDKVTGDAVCGRLLLDGVFVCNTLERRCKMLPFGTYSIEVNQSQKFKRKLPLLYNGSIKASRGFRIHSGNTTSDSSGCVLVGTADGERLKDSREAESVVTYLCKSEKFLVFVDGTID